MPYNLTYDLKGKRIQDTFQNLLQYNTSSGISYDGTGMEATLSASYASRSDTASYALNAQQAYFANTASFVKNAITASVLNANGQIPSINSIGNAELAVITADGISATAGAFETINTDYLRIFVSILDTFSVAGNVLPLSDETYDVGASSYKWNNVYAKNLIGTSSLATRLADFASSSFQFLNRPHILYPTIEYRTNTLTNNKIYITTAGGGNGMTILWASSSNNPAETQTIMRVYETDTYWYSPITFASASVTGSLNGTSSWAQSASWAPGGNATLITGSTYQITASWAINVVNSSNSNSSSWASQSLSASFPRDIVFNDDQFIVVDKLPYGITNITAVRDEMQMASNYYNPCMHSYDFYTYKSTNGIKFFSNPVHLEFIDEFGGGVIDISWNSLIGNADVDGYVVVQHTKTTDGGDPYEYLAGGGWIEFPNDRYSIMDDFNVVWTMGNPPYDFNNGKKKFVELYNPMTGSLFGTSSWAIRAVSASIAETASYSLFTVVTSSTSHSISASWASQSMWSDSASWASQSISASAISSNARIRNPVLIWANDIHSYYQVNENAGGPWTLQYSYNDNGNTTDLITADTNSIHFNSDIVLNGALTASTTYGVNLGSNITNTVLYANAGGNVVPVPTNVPVGLTASNAVSASWAPTAGLTTGATYQITSSWAVNATNATNSLSAISASWASRSLSSTSASFLVSTTAIGRSNGGSITGNSTSSRFVAPDGVTRLEVAILPNAPYVTLATQNGNTITVRDSDNTVQISADTYVSADVYANNFRGPLVGTSSWAYNVVNITSQASVSWASSSITSTSASWASSSLTVFSASYASASTFAVSASWASSSLTSISTSYASASTFAFSSSWASRSFASVSSSYASASTFAVSASWASRSFSSSYAETSSRAITSSYARTASWADNSNATLIEGATYQITASWAINTVNGGTPTEITPFKNVIPLPVHSARLSSSNFARINDGDYNWELLYEQYQSASWQFMLPTFYSRSFEVQLQYYYTGVSTGTASFDVDINGTTVSFATMISSSYPDIYRANIAYNGVSAGEFIRLSVYRSDALVDYGGVRLEGDVALIALNVEYVGK